MASGRIHQLAYTREREDAFRASFVNGEVEAHTVFPILLGYYHWAGNPFRIVGVPEEFHLLQFFLNFFFYCFGFSF